jgi:branched-chain amino acid transport system permease protein
LDLADHLNLILAGLTQGALYALVAMGFNMTYLTTGVLNFAQGEFLMLGAMIGVFFAGSLGWPLVPALIVTLAIIAVIGAVEEVIAVRPALRLSNSATGWILSTLGVSILIRAVISLTMGQDVRRFPDILSRRPWLLGDVRLVPQQLLIIGVAVVLTVVLRLVLGRTVLGKAFEAVAQDREAAQFRGLPIGRISSASFGIGAVICGVAGFVAAPLLGTSPSIGLPFVLKGFIAATIGGIGRLEGALVGGLALGVAERYGSNYLGADYQDVVVFFILLAGLAIRPQGLFGRLSIREV